MLGSRRRRACWIACAAVGAQLLACSFDEPDYTGKLCGGSAGVCPAGWVCDPASGTCAAPSASASGAGGAGGMGGVGGVGGTGGVCVPEPEECRTPAVDDDCDGVANDHCAVWSLQHKQPDYLQLPFAVTIDPVSGSVVAVGQSTSGTNDNVMIVAVTPDGKPSWALDLGDAKPQEAQGVSFDPSGDLLIAGFFDGTLAIGADVLTTGGKNDAFVAKLSAAGDPIWARGFGGTLSEEALALAPTADGGMVISGNFYGTGPFGSVAVGRDAYVARLDASGALVWSRSFGGAGSDSADYVRVAADGGIVAAGFVEGSVDFGQGAVTTDGPDAFVARWTDAGDLEWARTFTGPLAQGAEALALDPAGNVYIGGTFESSIDFFGRGQLAAVGTQDAFVAALGPGGAALLWSRAFGAPSATQKLESVAVVGDDLFLAGALEGSVDFGGGTLTVVDPPDVFLVNLDAKTGAHRWSRRFGLSGNQGYRGVAMEAAASGIVLAGDFGDGSIDLGNGVLTAADPGDAFIAEFAP